MKHLYPYDPHANLSSNYVTESVDTALYPNRWNVVVPVSAPFYRIGLEVKSASGQLLIEGLDYFLGHYASAVADATQKASYGSILLIDQPTATVKMRVVGSNSSVPVSEIGRYLTRTDLEDPRNCDWSELQRYPVPVAPLNPPANIEEAIDTDAIVAELTELREKITSSTGVFNGQINEVFKLLSSVEDDIVNNHVMTHHQTPHHHKYTAESIGALKDTDAAVDTLKAFGHSLQELTGLLVRYGISQPFLDELLLDDLAPLMGRLHVEDGALTFKNIDTDAFIRVNRYTIELGNGNNADTMDIHADANNNNPTVGVQLGAGINMLYVPSDGNVVHATPPILNGKFVITEDKFGDYVKQVKDDDMEFFHESTDTLKVTGQGRSDSPFTAYAEPPIASNAVAGLFSVTSTTDIAEGFWGISQWAVTVIRDTLNNYVDKSFKINGLAFGDDEHIDLTRTHLGIDKTNNTYESEKPAHTALLNALANRSKKTHTHVFSDLTNVKYASATVRGLVMLYDAISSEAGKAVTARQGKVINDKIAEVRTAIEGRVKASAASATHFGGDGYLPVPALGNYGHANYSYPSFYGEEDRNYKWTILVNLASSFGRGVYYQEIQLSETGVVISHNKSSVKYSPPFLKNLGREAKYVLGGLNGLMWIRDDADQNWLVRTMGTMDMSKHIGCKTGATDRSWRYTIHGDMLYCVTAYTGMDDVVKVMSAPMSQFVEGGQLTWTPVSLNGKDIFNNEITGDVKFAPITMSEDKNAQSLIWRNDGGKWTRVGPRHSTQNWDMVLDGDTLVVYTYQRAYCSNSYTSSYGPSDQTTCTKINLKTKRFVIQQPELMRQTLDVSGIVSQDHTNLNRWPGVEPNNSSNRIFGKKFALCGRWYGTHSTQSMYITSGHEGKSLSARCERKAYGYAHHSSATVNGPTPSVISSVRSHPAWLNNRTIAYSDLITGYNVCEINPDQPYPNDNGLGPTTNRKKYDSFGTLCKIPRDWKTGAEKNQGYVGTPNNRRKTRSDDDGNFFDEYVWNDANGKVLRDRCYHKAVADGAFVEGALISHQVYLTIFGDPKAPIRAFVNYSSYHYRNANRDIRGMTAYIYEVQISVSSDVISVSDEKYIKHQLVNGNSTGMSTDVPTTPQPMTYLTEEGIRGFELMANPTNSHVGNSGRIDYSLQDIPGGGYKFTAQMRHYYQFNNLKGWHPKFGYYRYQQTAAADAVVGYVSGRKAADIWAGVKKDTVYILASTAEEGWIVYFTQDLPFFCEGANHIVKAQSFDLRALFPADHKNATFQIHVDFNGGEPTYVFDHYRLADTSTRLWCGHVTTDGDRIIELVVRRAKRLGGVGRLLEHAGNRYAHTSANASILDGTKYEVLINRPLRGSFELPSFKDVFDKWPRFSHNTAGKYPANAVETSKFFYTSALDVVTCSVNSATYIGFMSEEKVGDYWFSTMLSSNSEDDDTVGVVLAGLTKDDTEDGTEHTISVLCSGGGDGHGRDLGSYSVIRYNHYQSGTHGEKEIAKLIPGGTVRNNRWNQGWAFNVCVKKEGNFYDVYVKRVRLANAGDVMMSAQRDNYAAEARSPEDCVAHGYYHHRFDVTKEAPIMARSCRYGYSAMSQDQARWWNIRRPMDDLTTTYASEQTLYSLNQELKAEGRAPALIGMGEAVASDYAITHPSDYEGFWKTRSVNYEVSPTHANPACVGIQSPNLPEKDAYFYVKFRFWNYKAGLKVQMLADDVGECWINGTSIGTVALANVTLKTFNVSSTIAPEGECVVVFKVYERHAKGCTWVQFIIDSNDPKGLICSGKGDYTNLPVSYSSTVSADVRGGRIATPALHRRAITYQPIDSKVPNRLGHFVDPRNGEIVSSYGLVGSRWAYTAIEGWRRDEI